VTAAAPGPPPATPTAWPGRSAWPPTGTAPPPWSPRLGDPGAGGRARELSPREAEVASLVAEGLTNRQIAERLVISERTAQNQVQHILTKLGFATRSQIAAWRSRAPIE
jgi:DNA-binding NarL/FixJ family response regulator